MIRRAATVTVLAILLVLAIMLSHARAQNGRERLSCGSEVSPAEAEQMLTAQGYGIGTVKQVFGVGRVAVAGMRITTVGRWLRIEVLLRTPDRRTCDLPKIQRTDAN